MTKSDTKINHARQKVFVTTPANGRNQSTNNYLSFILIPNQVLKKRTATWKILSFNYESDFLSAKSLYDRIKYNTKICKISKMRVWMLQFWISFRRKRILILFNYKHFISRFLFRKLLKINTPDPVFRSYSETFGVRRPICGLRKTSGWSSGIFDTRDFELNDLVREVI